VSAIFKIRTSNFPLRMSENRQYIKPRARMAPANHFEV
jgi:hypothetical protein